MSLPVGLRNLVSGSGLIVIARILGGFESRPGFDLTLRALRDLSPITAEAVACAIYGADRIAVILIPTTTEEALQIVLFQAPIDEARIDPEVGWKRLSRRPYSFLPLWISYCTARLAKRLDTAELLKGGNRGFEKLLYSGDGTKVAPEYRGHPIDVGIRFEGTQDPQHRHRVSRLDFPGQCPSRRHWVP